MYLIGNWKMHLNVKESIHFAQEIKQHIGRETSASVVLCPPYVSLEVLSSLLEMSPIELGAQNMHFEEVGAFTGEISPLMIKDFCKYVIVGHSERRQFFGEDDEMVNKKVLSALKHDLRPILCIGEDLATFEANKTFVHLEHQLVTALKDITNEQLSRMLIAYEPCWAIGSGHIPKRDDIDRIGKFIALQISKMYDLSDQASCPIIYGGSVQSHNLVDIVTLPHIEGVLVGGASIEAAEFCSMYDTLIRIQ
jgi:triosephosphate isomerase